MTEDKRTIIDCVKVDKEELDNIQKTLDMLSRHNFRASVPIHYGKCTFEIKLINKEAG